jgi:hypothetical protein
MSSDENEQLRAVPRTGYVGWVEFLRDQVSTTHIAYLHEDGSVYLPEGPQVVSEMDLRMAEIAGSMWPLVRADWLIQ